MICNVLHTPIYYVFFYDESALRVTTSEHCPDASWAVHILQYYFRYAFDVCLTGCRQSFRFLSLFIHRW